MTKALTKQSVQKNVRYFDPTHGQSMRVLTIPDIGAKNPSAKTKFSFGVYISRLLDQPVMSGKLHLQRTHFQLLQYSGGLRDRAAMTRMQWRKKHLPLHPLNTTDAHSSLFLFLGVRRVEEVDSPRAGPVNLDDCLLFS